MTTPAAPAALHPPRRVRDAARRLAREADGLPAYIYDLAALADHAAAIRAALPRGVQWHYAVKANPDPLLLRVIARYADGLEVASGGELRHAAAAVPGVPLAFGGPGKTPAELAAALRDGAPCFHVESPRELRQLGTAARAAGCTASVLLRVNLPVPAAAPGRGGLVMGGQPSPFGMDPGLLDDCARWLSGADGGWLRLRGLHAHLASGLDAEALAATAAGVLRFARPWCARHQVSEPEINLGGGMAVDYANPGRRFDWAGYGARLARLTQPGETLRIEPGRAVTAYCGWYATRVLDTKRSHGELFAVVAGGTHHLRTPAAKGHDQPFTVIPGPPGDAGPAAPQASREPVTIVGQLCTPKDVLVRRVPVTRLRTGDTVAFGLAGAYAWNISHHGFLMHPPPRFRYVGASGQPGPRTPEPDRAP